MIARIQHFRIKLSRLHIRCRLPYEYPNATYHDIPESMFNMSYPWETGQKSWSSCRRLDANFTEDYFAGNIPASASVKCDSWLYDTTFYKSSTVKEWDLVCDNAWLRATGDSMFMLGDVLGSVTFGFLSDRYGRRPIFFVALALQLVSGVLVAVSPGYIFFMIFRLLVGSTASGEFLIAYVIALEMVGPSKRVLAGVACQLFFTTGYILTAGFAYFITDWRMLQVALTVPAIGFLSYWWFLPESTRWLLANGRPEEAKVFLLKAAKENKVIIPPDVLDGLVPEGEKEKVPLEPERKPSFFDLIRYPNLRKRALNIFLNWFVNNSTYYGLSWNTSNLGGNDYLNFVISGAVEVPAYTFLILTLNRWGRKSILCGCMLLGGAALLLTLAVPIELNWLTITLAMIGKLAVTASYGTIYVFTAEQFPTVIRNVALGASSTCARAGGITAPYINLLADTWRSLPLLIFGVMITTGGLLALQLPETLNKKLPDTIQEGEKFGCKPKFEEEQHGRELEIVHKLGSKGSMA
ncbi:organic cation transporter protein isoform X2 [Anabrus simplex]|uniref:organic cation transporter protein isoform X2 n=1 Tax=Anabrus simplex TaxID=316456 RepID=UPI0034DD14B1